MGSVSASPLPLPAGISAEIASQFIESPSQLGPNGQMGVLENKQGLKLRTYYWPASKPKALIVLVHGHNSYSVYEFLKANPKGPGHPSVYEGSWVETLNKHGYSVCACDSQGCGLSEGVGGLRSYFNSFDDVVDDVVLFVRSLDTCRVSGFQNLPRYILGISMGGAVTILAAHREPSLFRGVVLLAPMISLERVSRKGLNPYLRPLSAVLSFVSPAAAIVATERNVMFPTLQEYWDKDPIVGHGNTRVRVAVEFLRSTELLCSNMHTSNFPFIVFHSEKDTMTDPDGSKKLYKLSQAQDKTLRLVNSMWHILTKEDDCERVLSEAVEWMDARLTPTSED